MNAPALLRPLLDTLLFDWLKVEQLCARPRHADLDRAAIEAMLEGCERVAVEAVAPAGRVSDQQEPQLDAQGQVQLPAAVVAAVQAHAATGLLAAAADHAHGGLQLPCVVETAANAFFSKASVGVMGYGLLTAANANLLLVHGTPAQRRAFAEPGLRGETFGTMCLSEPQAGSSLGDIRTRAVPDGPDFAADPLGPRYRLKGQKMWISGGDHGMGRNIHHLVLAKVPGADGRLLPGTAGISLFVVPKFCVGAQGQVLAQRNDVVLTGLNHKLGWRGTVNCLLSFGEGEGAIGYRVGAEGQGLAAMFHMMNEARIGVGLSAVMLGFAAYEVSRAYAFERTQGRAPGSKDPSSEPLRLVDHVDVRRMLLRQKAFAYGGLALQLYAARLVDDTRTGTPEASAQAAALLQVLIPLCKSWPSQWGLEGNSLAIQVLGGAGYTRDWPLEQWWRDNRLNMIHEGTHGIQGIDLVLRKLHPRAAGLPVFAAAVNATVQAALDRGQADWAADAQALAARLSACAQGVKAAWREGTPEAAAVHASALLQAFGHLAVGWIWLDLVRAAPAPDLRAAQQHFFVHELPLVDAWLAPVLAGDRSVADTPADWC